MEILNQIMLSTLLGAVCVLPIAAHTAEGLKPGQWEVTVKTTKKNMPTVPADQLAEMKKMGIKMPGNGEPMQVQTCITPEQASLENMSKQPNKDCKMQNFKHSVNKASGEMVCTGEMRANGKFEMVMESDTVYHATSTLKGMSKTAGPIDQSTEIDGKWLKAQCDSNVVPK